MRSTRLRGKSPNFSGPAKTSSKAIIWTCARCRRDTDVVRASGSVAESMENLRRLAEERLRQNRAEQRTEYGTIAIQRYERSDGTNSWLVTIPGTDGQPGLTI